MKKKLKVFTISDHPLMASGVAHTMRNIITALLESGEFEVFSLGGAIKHDDYSLHRVQDYGDDWVIQPVDGFGTKELIRSALRTQKPDVLLYQSDPRFFIHLHQMANEIRPLVPTVWYGIWDNYPYPLYNRSTWNSCDHFASISKVTHDLVSTVCPTLDNTYLPHAVDHKIFKTLDKAEVTAFREEKFPQVEGDKFIAFWNNRNARRKHSGTLILWWKEFLDKVGHENATLIMHTNPFDQHGQNLIKIIKDFNLTEGQVIINSGLVSQESLNLLYNLADVTVNISDAEGFGLTTLESLSAGTPIIVNTVSYTHLRAHET